MLSSYFSGLTKEEKEEAENEYKSAFLFRQRLIKLLEKQIDTDFKAMLNEEEFNPNNHIERLAKIKATKKVVNFLK